MGVRCDGASNVTDCNCVHSEKTVSPRVETEDGTVNSVKLQHCENATRPILRIWAGDSKKTVCRFSHPSKQWSPIERTDLETWTKRSALHDAKPKIGKCINCDSASKTRLVNVEFPMKAPGPILQISEATQKVASIPLC
jgi:hypothetical protein